MNDIPTMPSRIAVIGSGSWGTALATLLAGRGHEVMLWARRKEMAERIATERRNPDYLPDTAIPSSVGVTSNLADALRDAAIIVFATPSQSIRTVAGKAAPLIEPDSIIVSVAKGIENETLLTTTGVLEDVLTHVPRAHLAVLYGPSHAEEVVQGVPTAVVVAAHAVSTAERVQRAFMTPTFRVYVNEDVTGVEIAGSVKNILAIASGISEGLGFGDNARAALLTRGLAEIKRLGAALGADPATFSGLAGIGDLVVTCTSRHSRNRFLGEQIGRGKTLEQVESEMKMIAEGVRTTASVHDLARRLSVEMPITEAVHDILFEHVPPLEAVEQLMMRSAKQEDGIPLAENQHSRTRV